VTPVQEATLAEVQRRLDEELRARDGKMRRLASEIADKTGEGLETVRRALYRILREGLTPSGGTSATLERGLRKPPGYFTVNGQDVGARRDRLAKLEEEVVDLTAALETSRRAQAQLLRRVAALERRLPAEAPRSQRAATPKRPGHREA
jgi:hypothetical protein